MKKKLARNPDLPYQKILEEVLIVAPRERKVHRLNEVAAHVWLTLEQPRSFDDLARSVTEVFNVDEKTAKKDLTAFVTELKEKGLVQ